MTIVQQIRQIQLLKPGMQQYVIRAAEAATKVATRNRLSDEAKEVVQ